MSSIIYFKRAPSTLPLEEIKQQAKRSWLSSQSMPTEIVDALVTEVERLLERAQVAEAALQEAVAREAALTQALRDIRTMLLSNNMTDIEKLRYVGDTVRLALLEKTTVAAAALLERLAELETQVADLRGLLQGVRTSLERASDLLASPVEVEGAQNFIEGALEAVIEEIAGEG